MKTAINTLLCSLLILAKGATASPQLELPEARSLEARRVADPQACGDPRLLAPFFRLWNPIKKDDFYTTNATERAVAISSFGYNDEGVAGYIWPNTVPQPLNTVPFYRIFNGDPSVFNHFYTTSVQERDNDLAASGSMRYTDEGIAGYVYTDASCGGLPLYRLWSVKAQNDFYTMDAQERDDVIKGDPDGYVDEGTRAYIIRF